MSEQPQAREERMVETVRRVVARRECAPRSPQMERAFKRLIWRYTGLMAKEGDRVDHDVKK
ncbi:MAG: hypothetical protein ACP5JJ_17260 [Anaerolineae bacterium]